MANTNQFHKNLNKPDEVRKFKSHGHLDFVQLGRDISIGRAEFEPGWTWERDVKPIAGTATCEAAHAGYCASGTMTIRMNDGTEFQVRAGEAYQIPPGHTARVEGKESCVMIDVMGFQNYAKPAEKAA
ncbi:MAG: cupin domain-containing protein [Bdellovibrionota bacterium]